MDQAEATDVVNATFESDGPFLLKYAYRRLQSMPAAEDIVQETFLALYRDLRLGKQIREPRHWVLGAVRNQICKYARSSRRRSEELVPSSELDRIPAQTFTYVEPPEQSRLLLSVLTPREEEVILLRLQSLKYREIAESLGIGTKSVCTLLARAIRKLRGVAKEGIAPRQTATKRREMSSALH